jgi:hypothetical protein
MRASVAAAAFVICAVAINNAEAAKTQSWRITKTEWTESDEKGFGDFVKAIAESGCSTTIDCIRGPGNPFRETDPKALQFVADCADFPYMLRAYYAWKNGLPFSYVNGISGQAADVRFGGKANRAVSRRDIVDRGAGIPALAVLNDIHMTVSSATYRSDAAEQGPVPSDFYSPKLAPGAVRPGTAIYDINGHVTLVYDIDPDGRIRYVDADPDHTVSRSIYGPQFGQSPSRLGGGFKNFRPMKLVGAKRTGDGSYIGGRIVLAQDEDIPDFSLEQYRGNVADAQADGDGALFQYAGTSLGYFEYVRAAMNGGKFRFNPVEELRMGIDSLCHELQERAHYVDVAVQDGIADKPHPARLPGNIYGADDVEWESYSTPSRDARLKNTFALLYQDLNKLFIMWQAGDARISYDGRALKEDLQRTFAERSQACSVKYTNSAGEDVTLDFAEVTNRLFSISFDPYHCVERRWGATEAAELASCKDDALKTRWYKAEQRLRNQAERTYSARESFSLAEMEKGAKGTGTEDPPPTDIKHLIDNIGSLRLASTMKPVGF